MHTALSSFRAQAIFRMEEKLEHLGKSFQYLGEEDMWWRPNEQSNSVANLIIHLSGNISQYILSSLDQQPDTRDRDSEFAARGGWSKTELIDLITETIEQANQVIQTCPDEELLRQRSVQGLSLMALELSCMWSSIYPTIQAKSPT
ncbi:MAG: DUF1572 family protein [Bacteroidota bacterium]